MSDHLDAICARIRQDMHTDRKRLRAVRKSARELWRERVDVETCWGGLDLLVHTLEKEGKP